MHIAVVKRSGRHALVCLWNVIAEALSHVCTWWSSHTS